VSAWLISRRLFLTHVASVAALFGVASQAAASPTRGRLTEQGAVLPADSIAPLREPVVSFHMDQPYLDMTGTAVPYHPPAGTRSGQPIADLSVEDFYACFR